MIAKLKGRIDAVGADYLAIDVNGVGYHVACSAKTLAALPSQGEFAEVHTQMLVSQDDIRLVGFATVTEREWFRLLQSVQGVGTKVALAILSTLSTHEIGNAIALQDKAMIGRANGVGKKLAERIVLELKDKTPAFAGLDQSVTKLAAELDAPRPTAAADAVSALVNLGYGQVQAGRRSPRDEEGGRRSAHGETDPAGAEGAGAGMKSKVEVSTAELVGTYRHRDIELGSISFVWTVIGGWLYGLFIIGGVEELFLFTIPFLLASYVFGGCKPWSLDFGLLVMATDGPLGRTLYGFVAFWPSYVTWPSRRQCFWSMSGALHPKCPVSFGTLRNSCGLIWVLAAATAVIWSKRSAKSLQRSPRDDQSLTQNCPGWR